jgi:phosphate transport system permease protein
MDEARTMEPTEFKQSLRIEPPAPPQEAQAVSAALILFTGAVSLGAVPHAVFNPTRTLSYGSYDMAIGDRLAMMVPHHQYGMVVTLVLLILILNAAAILLRIRVFKKLRGR